jgi:hypothetical protein
MNERQRKPRFFFVGAPRCGTSSMTSHLAQHPEICISTLKEPNYFADDLDLPKPASEREYLALYEPGAQTKILGEASVLYLYSTTAAERIQAYSPDARILIFLRNPIEAAYSWYAQMRFTANEPLTTFEAALDAEARRRAGNLEGVTGAAKTCPQLLLYREVYTYAAQVERYLRAFDRSQLMIVDYDEFRADGRKVFRDVCSFLDVDPEFIPQEKNINAPQTRRSWKLHYAMKKAFAAPTRALLPAKFRFRLIKVVDRINSTPSEKERLDASVREQLAEDFRPGVERLSALLGTDYTRWCAAKSDRALAAASQEQQT